MKLPYAERRIASIGGELTYSSIGSGKPILLLNGLLGSWHCFRPQIVHFADRCRCLVWDYRGLYRDQARRPRSAISVAEHAADALAILKAEGAERAVLVGWSLGAQVALQLFATAPEYVSSLILVGGGARPAWGDVPEAGPIRRLYPSLFHVLERVGGSFGSLVRGAVISPEAFTWARRIGLVGPDIDPELFAEVAQDLTRLDLPFVLQTAREMMRADQSSMLASVDVPTLVIGGERDPLASRAGFEQLVRGIAGAEYLLLPAASHYLLMDHAQHVNLRITKFFAERGIIHT